MTGRVVHFEIPFDDAARASAFYSAAFGWTVGAVPGMDYRTAATGPAESGPPSEPGYINGGLAPRGAALANPTVVVDVEDIEATLARVEELGGATVLPRTPVGELGFSAYFTDSEGNLVGLWQGA